MYLFGVEGASFERDKKAQNKQVEDVYESIKNKLLTPRRRLSRINRSPLGEGTGQNNTETNSVQASGAMPTQETRLSINSGEDQQKAEFKRIREKI